MSQSSSQNNSKKADATPTLEQEMDDWKGERGLYLEDAAVDDIHRGSLVGRQSMPHVRVFDRPPVETPAAKRRRIAENAQLMNDFYARRTRNAPFHYKCDQRNLKRLKCTKKQRDFFNKMTFATRGFPPGLSDEQLEFFTSKKGELEILVAELQMRNHNACEQDLRNLREQIARDVREEEHADHDYPRPPSIEDGSVGHRRSQEPPAAKRRRIAENAQINNDFYARRTGNSPFHYKFDQRNLVRLKCTKEQRDFFNTMTFATRGFPCGLNEEQLEFFIAKKGELESIAAEREIRNTNHREYLERLYLSFPRMKRYPEELLSYVDPENDFDIARACSDKRNFIPAATRMLVGAVNTIALIFEKKAGHTHEDRNLGNRKSFYGRIKQIIFRFLNEKQNPSLKDFTAIDIEKAKLMMRHGTQMMQKKILFEKRPEWMYQAPVSDIKRQLAVEMTLLNRKSLIRSAELNLKTPMSCEVEDRITNAVCRESKKMLSDISFYYPLPHSVRRSLHPDNFGLYPETLRRLTCAMKDWIEEEFVKRMRLEGCELQRKLMKEPPSKYFDSFDTFSEIYFKILNLKEVMNHARKTSKIRHMPSRSADYHRVKKIFAKAASVKKKSLA